MSTSTVKLYHSGGTYGNWELLPEKLLIVDDISAYLATKTAVTLSGIQYQKLKLEMQLKLDLSQKYAAPLTSSTFKYISIQNENESIHYYFVKKIDWASMSCVVFDLVLDVLNTFKEGTDYDFKENTRIIREHKSRFKRRNYVFRIQFDNIVSQSEHQIVVGDEVTLADNATPLDPQYTGKVVEISYGTPKYVHVMITDVNNVDHVLQWLYDLDEILIESSSGEWLVGEEIVNPTFISNEWFRSVDYIPEGINPLLQHGGETTYPVEDEYPLDIDWYLVYRNQNEPDAAHQYVNPVDCFLLPGQALTVKCSSITAGKMNANVLESGKYYLIMKNEGGHSDILTLDDGTSIGVTSNYECIYLYKNQNDRIVVSKIRFDPAEPGNPGYPDGVSYETSTITLNHLPQGYRTLSSIGLNESYLVFLASYQSATLHTWTNGDVNLTTDDITKLDRTDSRLIKVIKLPYCPYDFTITGVNVDISNDTNWEYASCQAGGTCYCFKLLKTPLLERHLEGYPTLQSLKFDADDFPEPHVNDNRITGSAWFDPKLLMSEFHSDVYFYDSFAFKVDLENLNLDKLVHQGYDFDSFAITFTTTKTINSKFMFTFSDYVQRLSKSNVSQVLTIARNNEEVLYNVPYINFIRSGYNYEVKAKNLQLFSNIGGIALSGGALLTSLIVPTIPLKAAAIAGAAFSIANSVKSTIVSAMSAENSLQKKMDELKRQADSVLGSDDVDLMSEYCGNRLRNVIYEPNPIMKKTIDELFFYAGYRSDRLGIPSHINRINFDYLECEPSLENVRSIPSDCLSELIKCFKTGVTYMHRNSMIGWDFDQSHENWERFIFD